MTIEGMFADAETVEAVIYQAIGAGSVCWDQVPGGVFDDQQATKVGKAAVARIEELWGQHDHR